MDFRTDLALERSEASPNIKGAKIQRRDLDNARITIVRVEDEEASRELGKPIGKYVTVEVPPFTRDAELLDGRLTAVSGEISALLPREGTVLIAGLGNESITPDALGPQTAEMLLATRHISGEVSDGLGLGRLRPVAVITPGVLGKTGMETTEIIGAAVRAIKPCAVITVDALACRSLSRLGCTVQMSDSGITPAAGSAMRAVKSASGRWACP